MAPDGTNIIAATICRHIDSAMVKAEAHFGAQRLNRLVIKLNITALGVSNGRESDGALTQPHLNACVAPTRENRLPCLVLVGTKARLYCGPVLRHSARAIQAANSRSAVAF